MNSQSVSTSAPAEKTNAAASKNYTKFIHQMQVNSMKRMLSLLMIATTAFCSCAQNSSSSKSPDNKNNNTDMENTKTSAPKDSTLPSGATDTATFANGCFWCTEAIFEQLDGVISSTSGYTGGKTENPTYKQVCTGETGHAEALQIVYDPKKISFDELLEVFWQTHDPTTLNRQGNDIGTQYRSGIFYHNQEQKEKAEKYKVALDKSGAFDRPIVTEITAFTKFYPAEDYHQQYFDNNEGSNPYCTIVIRPKVEKFKKVFKDKLKKHQ
jgi:peptide-methionine (S)-S-oxide reductase